MEADEQQNQCVTFFVAGEEYALGIREVKEIVEFKALTKVPSAPTAVRGVVNLRGRVVPVVDLAVQFGLSETKITRRACVVMVEASRDGALSIMGILADAVSQVMEVPVASVQAPPKFGTEENAAYLKGVASIGEKFLLILDLPRVLAALDSEALGMADAAEPAAAEGGVDPQLGSGFEQAAGG